MSVQVLNTAEKDSIVKAVANGESQTAVAKRFGVSRRTIGRVIATHVVEETPAKEQRTVKCVSEEQQQIIAFMFGTGMSKTEIAKSRGVSVRTIGRIIDNHPEAVKQGVEATVSEETAKPVSEAQEDEAIQIIHRNPNTGEERVVRCVDTETQKDIAFMFGTGASKTKIAKLYEVSIRTVGRIIVNNPESVEHGRIQAVDKKIIHKTSKGGDKAKKPVNVEQEKVTFRANKRFIAISVGTTTYNADKDHPNFIEALEALKRGHVALALELINIEQAVRKYTQGHFLIEGDVVSYKGIVLDNSLTQRVIKAMNEDKPFKHLLRFFENLTKNPSKKAVERLFDFLAHNDIELSEDGQFYAWKRVNDDFTDMATSKFDNSPGKIVKMKRSEVDDDDARTCSRGLHVAAKSYLPHYGGGRGKIIQCKVHPRDVVSIPVDYDNAKMRVCRYQVCRDVTEGFSHYE